MGTIKKLSRKEKDELIDELLLAMHGYGKDSSELVEVEKKISEALKANWGPNQTLENALSSSAAEANVGGISRDIFKNIPKPDEAHKAAFDRYKEAINNFIRYKTQIPDWKKRIEKREAEIKKKYAHVIADPTKFNEMKTSVDTRMSVLVNDIKSSEGYMGEFEAWVEREHDKAYLSRIKNDETAYNDKVLDWVLKAGSNEIKNYPSPKEGVFKNRYLQLRAFKHIHDAMLEPTKNIIPALIATEKATKELRASAISATSRYLHYLSFVAGLGVPAGLSYRSRGTVYYAGNRDKLDALNQFKSDTKKIIPPKPPALKR